MKVSARDPIKLTQPGAKVAKKDLHHTTKAGEVERRTTLDTTTLRKVPHHAKVWGRDAHAKKSHYKGGIRGKWQKKSK